MNAPMPIRASEFMRALGSGWPSHIRERKLFVIFQTFIDESVSEVGARSFVMAGYLSSLHRWETFSDAWHAILMAEPTLPALHMRKWPRGFTKQAKAMKIAALVEVVQKFSPIAFEVSLRKSDFDEVFRDHVPKDLRNPYLLCFNAMVQRVARFVDKANKYSGRTESCSLEFIYDENGDVGLTAVLWFEVVRALADPDSAVRKLVHNPPIPRSDETTMPLQAADMLAWHLRRYRENPSPTIEDQITYRYKIGPGIEPFEISRDSLAETGEKFAAMSDLAKAKRTSLMSLLTKRSSF